MTHFSHHFIPTTKKLYYVQHTWYKTKPHSLQSLTSFHINLIIIPISIQTETTKVVLSDVDVLGNTNTNVNSQKKIQETPPFKAIECVATEHSEESE